MTIIAAILTIALLLQTSVFLWVIDRMSTDARAERQRLLDMRLANPQTQFVAAAALRERPEPAKDLAALSSIGTIYPPPEAA